MASRTTSILLWLLAGGVLFPASASAHKIHVTVHVHDTSIHGEVTFQGGHPAGNIKVTAFDPAGEKLAETTTDDEGVFTLQAEFRCDYRLLAVTGDGHGGEFTVTAAQLPSSLPPRGDVSTRPVSEDEPLEALRNEIILLRKELTDYTRQTRLRDVLGGIGYILGIAGIAFYFLGVRRKASKSTP